MGVSCSLCGRTSDPKIDGDPPMTWCSDQVEDMDGHHTRWICQDCTRRYVREIEAKLTSDWF